MKQIKVNADDFSRDTKVNIILESDAIGLKSGFVVVSTHGEVVDCIERAEKASEAKRMGMLLKVKRAIEVGNAFFDRRENQKLAGKCQAWKDLMDDCLIFVCYQYVQNGTPLRIVSDEIFDEMINDPTSTHVDPKFKKN